MAKEITDTQNVETGMSRFKNRMRERNADVDYDDEEAFAQQLSTDYDNYDRLQKEHDDMNTLLADDPMAPGLMAGLITKKNPDGTDFNLREYIIKQETGIEDEIAELRAKKKEGEDEAIAKEDAELDKFIKEQKLTPEEIKAYLDWLYKEDGGIGMKLLTFTMTADDFAQLHKAFAYDDAVASAEEKGKAAGRNEKIDMYKAKEARRSEIPNIRSNGNRLTPPKENETEAAMRRMSML